MKTALALVAALAFAFTAVGSEAATSTMMAKKPAMAAKAAPCKDAAGKFMKALMRGMRYYVDNLVDGHLAGPRSQEIIDIMVAESPLKDPRVYRDIVSHYVDPNGAVDEASLRAVWQFFKAQGQINGQFTIDDVLDLRFARAAAAELGPYQRAGKQ